MENEYSNIGLMDGYIKRIEEKMNTTPEMITHPEEKWMIIRNTNDNIVKFDNLISKIGRPVPEEWLVYFNDPEDYDKISEGIMLSGELNREKQKQENIKNPEIDEDIKNINSKEALLEFLLDSFYSNEHSMIWEYSSNLEEDEAKLNAEYSELLKLKEKYIN